MPIDPPKSGESIEDYLNYCIPEEIKAGKPQDQATAICYNKWRENMSVQGKVLSKMNQQRICLEEPCQSGYRQYGMKEKNGRQVPNCVPIEMKTQPTLLEEQEINVFGYNTKHFSICPGAIGLFTHLQEMPMEDDTVGMIRSAAQIADNVFRIEKEVVSKGIATSSELNEVELLVDDFKDVMEEIDEDVNMVHDVSFMDGHIQVIKSLL
jgi:hypothetical protein